MIITFLKGFIIGLGKIIPGVSGTLFACLFNVYNTIIESITNPRLILKNYKILFPLGLGIIFAIIFGSGLISIFLECYYVESMSLFIGMMSYGIVDLIKNNKNIRVDKYELMTVLIISFILIMLLFVNIDVKIIEYENIFREYISLFLCGILDAFSTIVPGVSGTALLMLVGYYNTIIEAFASINIIVLIPFIVGFVLGLIYIAKLVNYLFKNHTDAFNLGIIIFTIFSIFSLSLSIIGQINNLINVITLFIIGYSTTYLINKIK